MEFQPVDLLCLACVYVEESVTSVVITSLQVMCFFPFATSEIFLCFCFSAVVSNVTRFGFCFVFGFILCEVCRPSWFCDLISFISFGKFLASSFSLLLLSYILFLLSTFFHFDPCSFYTVLHFFIPFSLFFNLLFSTDLFSNLYILVFCCFQSYIKPTI